MISCPGRESMAIKITTFNDFLSWQGEHGELSADAGPVQVPGGVQISGQVQVS